MPSSSSSARILFVALFAVNCLLWSHSRYSVFQQKTELLSDQSLVKRISLELLNPSVQDHTQCRPISVPVQDQCAHVTEVCDKSQTFVSFDYLRSYFCTEPSLRSLAFVGLLVWLVFLFSTLGISASDFFTPNLATIAQLLGLDENVAGVTFLAFGNGSPDVFSTFSAMRAHSGSLAIGELLGAATFIVSCVVGSMCIIKPFQVRAGPFLRDVGFFSVAVSLLLVILWDGSIRPWEAALMIGLYLLYVAVVVIGTLWDNRRQRRRALEAMARAEYQDEPSSPYRDNPSSPSGTLSPVPVRTRAISAPGPLPQLQTDVPRRYSRTPSPPPVTPSFQHTHLPSFSLVGALEFREVVASLRHQASTSSLSIFDSPVTPYAGGHYHSHSHSHSIPRSRPRTPIHEHNPFEELNGLRLDDRSPPQLLVTPAPSDSVQQGHVDDPEAPPSMTASVPSVTHTPMSPTISDGDTESHIYLPPLTKRQRIVLAFRNIYHTIFPSLHNFRKQSVLGQIASLFAAPAVLMLTLTLPVVVTPYECSHGSHEKPLESSHNLIDFEEEGVERALIAEEEVQDDLHGVENNKWLMAAQCIFGPLFCVTVLFSQSKSLPWLLLAVGIAGVALAILVAVFGGKGDNPAYRMARCSMGFLVAIVWIMAIADEVVQVLRTFGFIFGLSDAIIGLTIFAVGNSLADLVANMSVAVFAPIMGFSACFGGPMLNILLGVGISGSYVTAQTSQPYELHFGTTLFVSGIGLLVLLAATLLVVPLNGYFLTRSWGIFLIVSYVVIMVVNVVVELKT